MKNVIFVVGFDYELHGLDFSKMCNGRLAYLIDHNRIIRPFKVTIFHFPRGRVEKLQIESNGTQKNISNEYLEAEFKAITKSMYGEYVAYCNSSPETFNFDKKAFKRDQDVLSITDVYDYIVKIGSGGEKKSIVELSFFAHSYHRGPIFVNSYDHLCHEPERDDSDKDCRASKDFNETNLNNEDKKSFKDSFDLEGNIWIFGCNMMKPFIQFIKRIIHDRKYSGIEDETELKLIKIREGIANFFRKPGSMSDAEKRNFINNRYAVKEEGGIIIYVDITVKFKYIKQMLVEVMKSTYAGQIAQVTNVNTFGGLLGTESDLFEMPKYSYMAIKTQGYRDILRFYEGHFNIEYDKERKNYVNYLKLKSK